MYFKITNKEENHNGFQYKDGLNVLEGEFNNDSNASLDISSIKKY